MPTTIWLAKLPPVATKNTQPEQLIQPHIQLSNGIHSAGDTTATQWYCPCHEKKNPKIKVKLLPVSFPMCKGGIDLHQHYIAPHHMSANLHHTTSPNKNLRRILSQKLGQRRC